MLLLSLTLQKNKEGIPAQKLSHLARIDRWDENYAFTKLRFPLFRAFPLKYPLNDRCFED